MAVVQKEDFDRYGWQDVDILEDGDKFDPCWGVNWIIFTEEQIDALKEGKVLYWSDGEYTTLVRYGTEDSI